MWLDRSEPVQIKIKNRALKYVVHYKSEIHKYGTLLMRLRISTFDKQTKIYL